MNQRHDITDPDGAVTWPILSAYVGTLALFLICSFFPEARVWGCNVWAYFPVYTRILLVALGLALGAFCLFVATRRHAAADPQPRGRAFLVTSVSLAAAAGGLFYLLRAQAHFLGDGYLQLATLAKENPLIKSRDFGEMLVHVWVKTLIGGSGEEAALASYQGLSILAGVAFVLVSALFARRLFADNVQRTLFLLGITTGGYMLLFFGYVENYSLLCLALALFTFTGTAVAGGTVRRWWLLPPLALSVFFHILGLTLVPAALYVLLAGTRAGEFLRSLNWKIKALLVLFVVAGASLVFHHLYSTSYFFRFAFVPFLQNRFTLDGYTLFSLKHVVDYLNLLVTLFPGVLLFAVLVLAPKRKGAPQDRRIVFLLVMVMSTIAATFVLEAKLGMPRDWDLFSLPGVPLALLYYILALSHVKNARVGRVAAVLAISLGLLALIPRAVVQHSPRKATDQFVTYITLDPHKNRSGAYVLQEYFRKAGDSTTYEGIKARRGRDYPEEKIADHAERVFFQGDVAEAKRLSDQAVELNPTYSASWLNLGRAFTALKQRDSAIIALQIANGLNPYSPPILSELGLAYYNTGDLESAKQAWSRVVSIEPTMFYPLLGLARLYQQQGDAKKYEELFSRAVLMPEAPPAFSKELGDHYLNKRDFERAAECYKEALARGLDSSIIVETIEGIPQLRSRMTP